LARAGKALWRRALAPLAIAALVPSVVSASVPASRSIPDQAAEWTAAWTASVEGAYPHGSPIAQPDLSVALPDPGRGFADQTLRMIVRPAVWGKAARIRLSNAFGTQPVTFSSADVGLQASGAMVVPGTNVAVRFAGRDRVTVAPGTSALSDPVPLAWVTSPGDRMLAGRKLAISFRVAGASGPATWHSKALTSSYLSAPGSDVSPADEKETGFPFVAMSWFFLSEVDMRGSGASTIVALGDSITDGTASTINGDDRWPDVLSRRLYAAYGPRFSVVNAGIGGNTIAGPPPGEAPRPNDSPSALARVERDVTSLPNVRTVIWLEGINDLGHGAPLDRIETGAREVVAILRRRLPGVRIVAATVLPSRNSPRGAGVYGSAETDAKRRAYNDFLTGSGLFDAVVDMAAAVSDPATGELKSEFQPNGSIGGPGDKLHPNRAGYAAMARAIDLKTITGIVPGR